MLCGNIYTYFDTNTSKRINVSFWSLSIVPEAETLRVDNFGWEPRVCATKYRCTVSTRDAREGRESEIREAYGTIVIDKNVYLFHVSVER